MFRAKQVCCNQAVFVVVQSDSLAVGRSLVFNHSSSTLRDRGLGSVAGTGHRGGAPGAALPRHPPPPTIVAFPLSRVLRIGVRCVPLALH